MQQCDTVGRAWSFQYLIAHASKRHQKKMKELIKKNKEYLKRRGMIQSRKEKEMKRLANKEALKKEMKELVKKNKEYLKRRGMIQSRKEKEMKRFANKEALKKKMKELLKKNKERLKGAAWDQGCSHMNTHWNDEQKTIASLKRIRRACSHAVTNLPDLN